MTHPVEEAPRSSAARDWVHLLVGSAFGLSLGLLLWHLRAPIEDADVQRYREVRDYVETRYVREIERGALLDSALSGMVRSLDPYSRYYGPAEVAAIERETSGHYRGIGVVFAMPYDQARILFALPGSPADKAGLRCGDQIVRVAGREVAGMGPGELRALLGAQDRADVPVVVQGRDGLERTLEIGQEALIDPSVRHARILEPELGLGYLAISSFSQETAAEFDRALEGLSAKGMRALIVDVRGNLGGVLQAATRIANRFLDGGLIVSYEGREESRRYEADPEEAKWPGLPLVVLVDGESASASEVFAAALQEHRAAVVVGSPTYGKGMVQQVKSFGEGEMIVKLINAYYYTPSHRNIERTVDGAWSHGLMPDVRVDLGDSELRRVRAFLASFSPPDAVLGELGAWEASEGRELYPRQPIDPQLAAALQLFRGVRPGAVARDAK